MSDTAFNLAVAKVMALEGGYSNLNADAGGRTMYGISEAAHPEAWVNGPPTEDQAREIYRAWYWTPAGCDYLPPPIALVVFDMAVNAGVTEAVIMLQRLIGTTVDARMGPVTISKARKYADRLLAESYQAARKSFYQDLARTKPEDQRFLLGWLNRLRSLDETLQTLV